MNRNLIIWVVITLALIVVFNDINLGPNLKQVSYSDFIIDVNSGRVQEIKVDGYQIIGKYTDGEEFESTRPAIIDTTLMDELIKNNVTVKGTKPEGPNILKQILLAAIPIILLLVGFMFIIRMQTGGGKNNPFSFGKNKAKKIDGGKVDVSFSDVAGVDEAKEDLEEIIDFLKDPKKFKNIGGKIPKGVLMSGPPGTGKTLLAKATAGEADVPFFFISGSDFVEMFVGVGASRVREMFEQARKDSPCILFIDEIDAVGRQRGAGLGGGHDEREQTLNQLLVEMDGFETHLGVIVIAATNRVDILDPALLRPGRFDRQIYVGIPDIKGREEILNVHIKNIPLGKDVDTLDIARGSPGFTGADLANLINESALFAAKMGKKIVEMSDFEHAKDKILMGAEKKSMIISDDDKLNTAYHESGHAIIGRLLENHGHDPVYKVSIIPRGMALGVTMFLPEKDKYSMSKQGILSSIKGLYGGRIAEELISEEKGSSEDYVTTGAQNDIERATTYAKNLVTKWGLSSLGPINLEVEEEEVFLGRSMGKKNNSVSAFTAERIDKEIKIILDECYIRAKKMLKDNRDKLEDMAKALVKYETITATQVDEIMAGEKVTPPEWIKMRKRKTASSKTKKKTNKKTSPVESNKTESSV